jgi:dihydropteroate synthase
LGRRLLVKEANPSFLHEIAPGITQEKLVHLQKKIIQFEGEYPEVLITAAESCGCAVYPYKRGGVCGLLIGGEKLNLSELAKRVPDDIQEELLSLLKRGKRGVKIGKKTYDLSQRPPLVMGILNVTPDSFSDGGKFFKFNDAVKRALSMVEEGADIIDIGGESTRPGSEPVPLEEERRRVIPLIKKLSEEIDVPISIDTYKPELATEALEAGAELINDIYGLRQEGMLELVKEAKVPVVIMHMQGTPKDMQKNPTYTEVVSEICFFLKERAKLAEECGLSKEEIILDPGIGFGKTLKHNLSILSRLEEFVSLGHPLLVGHSRKSFIGFTLDLPVEERLEGTLAVSAISTFKGADVIRVHDVKENLRAIKMAWALKEVKS